MHLCKISFFLPLLFSGSLPDLMQSPRLKASSLRLLSCCYSLSPLFIFFFKFVKKAVLLEAVTRISMFLYLVKIKASICHLHLYVIRACPKCNTLYISVTLRWSIWNVCKYLYAILTYPVYVCKYLHVKGCKYLCVIITNPICKYLYSNM